jgi:hypothetical protein
LLGLQLPEHAKLDFSHMRWGPNFGDETPGFCHLSMSQVLNVQALAKIECSKTSRLLDKTYGNCVPKFRSTNPVFKEHAYSWANTIIAMAQRFATTILGRGELIKQQMARRTRRKGNHELDE